MRKQCKACSEMFTAYNSIEAYCYECKCERMQKGRKLLNKPPLEFKKPRVSRKTKELKKGEEIFRKNSQDIKDEMLANYGYLMCEQCQTTDSFQFSTHHLVYRSEASGSPHLHNRRNLIFVCDDCHRYFHSHKKEARVELVKERGLVELFGNSIL